MDITTDTQSLQKQLKYWEDRANKAEQRLQQTIERGRAHIETLVNQLAQSESRSNILQAELERLQEAQGGEPSQTLIMKAESASELQSKLAAAEERAKVFESELKDVHYKIADRFLKGPVHEWFSALKAEFQESPPASRVEELLEQNYRLIAFGEVQRQLASKLQDGNTTAMSELLELRRQLAQQTTVLESAKSLPTDQNFDADLHRIAFEDPLTGLPNRALASKFLEQQLEHLQEGVSTLGIFVIDLDRLRSTNLTLGIEVGDALIQSFADRIKNQLRPDDVLTRGRDDEFIVIVSVPQAGGDGLNLVRQMVVSTATRIFESLSNPLVAGNHRLLVSASAGGVLCQQKEPLRIVMEKAHLALKQAKTSGRNRIQMHSVNMEEDGRRRVLLVPQLQQAIEEKQFRLQFQPVVELRTGAVWGVEALLRWKHPDEGMLPSRDFIDAALESGLIVPIGDWVVREAALITSHLTSHYLSINISAQELMQADFVRRFTKALELAHVTRPDRLVVEVSERDFVHEPERLIGALDGLRHWKVRLALDDFGFDSLSVRRVQAIGMNFLKINHDIIQSLDVSLNQALVKAMVQMANTLGAQCWAEGVETAEQLRQVQELGVHLAQGKALYPPMSPSEIRDKLG